MTRRYAVAAEPTGDFAPMEIVTRDQAQELAALLGPSTDVCELQALLNDKGTWYRWLLSGEDASRAKRMRDDLNRLADQLTAAMAALEDLDDRAKRNLLWALEDMPAPRRTGLPPPPIMPGTCRMYLAHVIEAAKLAKDALPSGGGRPGIGNLRWLCGELAAIYEAFSGRAFSYDAHHSGGTLNAFVTDGARWIEAAVRLIDPTVMRPNLGTAMRDLRKTALK